MRVQYTGQVIQTKTRDHYTALSLVGTYKKYYQLYLLEIKIKL